MTQTTINVETLRELLEQKQVEHLSIPEELFVESLLARIPPTPPNHHQIVALNESGMMFEGDPTELEAGANRCAVT